VSNSSNVRYSPGGQVNAEEEAILTGAECRATPRTRSEITALCVTVSRGCPCQDGALAVEGLDNDEITARLNTRREIVSKRRKRFFEQDLAGLEERPPGSLTPGLPPEVVVAVKVLACEPPGRLDVPLRRLYVRGIATEVVGRSMVAEISGTTIWLRLCEEAIRPWKQRSWIFARDSHFEIKAARVFHLYARI